MVFHWYINAARHFLENDFFHSIRCFVVDGSDSTLVKDLASEWKAQFGQQKLKMEMANRRKGENVSFKVAMLRELNYLTELADKAYGAKL